jgi:hypothetical protein
MLVNESFFDFALCLICYLLIALDFSYVLFLDLLAFCSTLVLCFLLFPFVFRSCLWPLLLFQLSFCRYRFLPLALIFGSCLASYFCFSFLIYYFYLVFTSCFCLSYFFFWLLLGSHLSIPSFIFHLWVKAHYGEPMATDAVFIINLFHNVKLESLFQNCKHFPLKLKICGFFKKPP